MKKTRNNAEEFAKEIIERVLNKEVFINDDNTQPGMYDLRIGEIDAPEYAIECISSADPVFTETWNVGPAKGSFYCKVQGDWTIEIETNAIIKSINKKIEKLLQEMENAKIFQISTKKLQNYYYDEILKRLKISFVNCYRKNGTGKIILTMSGGGGGVDYRGNSISPWIEEFITKEKNKDVIDKLQKSNAKYRHIFVFVALTQKKEDWGIISYLTDDFKYLPSEVPKLPDSINGIWIIPILGSSSNQGIYYNGHNWNIFNIN